ncbi:MAG: hypothetical protein V4719_19060 [Planctomycetota bacterium]
MIKDSAVLASVQEQWAVISRFRTSGARQYQVGESFINEGFPEDFYNLPLVLAYSLLDQVLGELIDQGSVPKAKGRLLGAKMEASRAVLP